MFPVAGAAAGSLPAYLGQKGQRSGDLAPMVQHSGLSSGTVPDRLGSLDGGPDAGLDVVVVTLVLVLFLTPHQVGVWETAHLRLHLVKRERRQLERERDRLLRGKVKETGGNSHTPGLTWLTRSETSTPLPVPACNYCP